MATQTGPAPGSSMIPRFNGGIRSKSRNISVTSSHIRRPTNFSNSAKSTNSVQQSRIPSKSQISSTNISKANSREDMQSIGRCQQYVDECCEQLKKMNIEYDNFDDGNYDTLRVKPNDSNGNQTKLTRSSIEKSEKNNANSTTFSSRGSVCSSESFMSRQSQSTSSNTQPPKAGGIKYKLKVRHVPKGGNVQIFNAPKYDYKQVKAKCGSLENSTYQAKGGNVQILNDKLQWKANSKIQSLANKTHTPKGGNIRIMNEKLAWKTESKINSLANIKHQQQGGNIRIHNEKLKFRTAAAPRIDTGCERIPKDGEVSSRLQTS
ncbi:hypothetical protein SNEBB_009967 [Seison nebaliae]|nr:hypothetical protein SNEBB_009967 [Seison nebaliae]